MGLLDNKDDMSSGLLAAGLAMLAARGVNPWQALGRGGLVGLNTMFENQQNRRRNELTDTENAYKKQQMSHMDLQNKQLQMKLDEEDAYKKALGQFTPAATPFGAAMRAAPSLSPTVGNVSAVASAAQSAPKMGVYERLLAMADFLDQQKLPAKAQEYRMMAEKYAPKYKGTETVMRDGKPVLLQQFENRAPEEMNYQPKPDYKEVSTGAEKFFVDPLTWAKGPAYAMQMSPSENDASKRGWAGLSQAERHFNITQGQPTFHEGQFVYKPTTQNPQGATIAAAGYVPKMPEAIRKELATLDAQEGTINGALKAVQETPTAFSVARGTATLAGTIPESIASRLDKPAEREARSYVFNIVSKVINERAGAAQSAQELARLRSFLPAETDNSQQITDKLHAFKKYIGDQRSAYTKNPQVETKADPLGIR